MNSEVWIALTPTVLLAVILHYLPLWRRQNLWFGVTVPTGFRDTAPAQDILHQYRVRVWALAAVAGILGVLASTLSIAWLLPGAVLLLTFAAMVVFALGRARTMPYSIPVTTRSAPLTPDTEALPGGTAAAIGPLGILLAAALYLHANWQRIPQRFPIHWHGSGTPDRWADKSWLTVYGPLLAGAALNVVILLLGEAILRYSPRARVANTAEWTARFRRVNVRLLMVVTWGAALILAWFATLPLLAGKTAFTLGLIAPVLLIGAIAPFIWQLIRLSQEAGTGSDGTPDRAWKLGQFYYNPDDPALLVEKRFGIGYTFNFGNRASWWFLGLLAIPVVVLVLK
jgi:uncharacterized membrane protein